jgi:predicted RNA-binding protein with PUA-like domain
VEIAREAYADPLQFDPTSKYYDSKATEDAPRWSCVDVKLVRKLTAPISLVELKQHSDGALSGMALFAYKRLSVQSVTPEEWKFVLSLEG